MRIVLLVLFAVLFQIDAFNQKEGPFTIGLSPKYGYLMAHRETMSHLIKAPNTAFEVEFSRQDTSGSAWSNVFKYPSRGLTFTYHDYKNPDVLGVSFSVYRFTKFPIFQHKKWGFFDFRLGNGVSYITQKYDEFSNAKNIAIGSYLNGFVNFQFVYTKQFKRLVIGGGVDFSHLSNASLKAPNQGLNTFTGFFRAGYSLAPRKAFNPSEFEKLPLEQVRKFNRWQFQFIFALKQNLPDHLQSRTFGVGALQALYRMPINRVWDFEIGIDLVYNEANRWFYEIKPVPVYQAFLLGAYAGMSLSIYKTQIYFGLGGYGLNLINPAGWIYNRTGIRFMTNEHWNLSFGIKAHIGVADYLEWGIGYRF